MSPKRDRPVAYDTAPAAAAATRLLAGVRGALRLVGVLHALTAGLVLFTAILVVASTFAVPWRTALSVAAMLGFVMAGLMTLRAWRTLTPLVVAGEVERRAAPAFDNLLTTAVELEQHGRSAHPIVMRALTRAIDERVRALSPSALVPLAGPIGTAVVVGLGTAITLWGVSRGGVVRSGAGIEQRTGGPTRDGQPPALRVVVTPPAYSGLPHTSVQDVAEIEALEGSRVRIELAPVRGTVQLIESGHTAVELEGDEAVRSIEIVAERTRFLLLRFSSDAALPDRLLAVIVKPDTAPTVRIRRPARDLLFAEPRGRVPIEIEATDDLALGALSLRYTRASGSGESLTFAEGDLPIHVRRVDAHRWEATAALSLEALKLEDGDTLVYRAITRDRRPGRDPSTSEAYLVEIGHRAQAASAGFALPEDKNRQALSQQMLIMKTERLHAERLRLSRDEFQERARLLAVEQRMVRAEFVFMTGGDVQDEVAEAEHSHELAEGRFENEGQVELLAAIREMSRAEARLNDAATEPALVFERAALKALQRAFDRRRYLLRTMPERARIDQTRRLTGQLKDARSWRRPPAPAADDEARRPLEALVRDLAAARSVFVGAGPNPTDLSALAARLGALDVQSPELQKAALALAASSGSPDRRTSAIAEAMRLVVARATRALAPTRPWVPHEPAAGRYADQRARGSAPR